MNTAQVEFQTEALSIDGTCKATGIGRTKIYEAIASGSLKARKFGKRTIILRGDLQNFLSALPPIECAVHGA